MMFVYGFIYYFLLAMIALTFGLVIFSFRPTRKILYYVESKWFKAFHNPIFKYTLYLSFAIIGLILLDSISNFVILSKHFSESTLRHT